MSHTLQITITLRVIEHRYACLKDGSGSAQPLLDTDFPDLSARGRAVSLGVYDHSYFMQLYVWGPDSDQNRRRKHRSGSNDRSATSSQEERPKMSLRERGDYEDYTQTYIIMRSVGATAGQSTTRDVIIRYGNWCYAGRIEMGTLCLS